MRNNPTVNEYKKNNINTHNTPQRTKVYKHINTQRIICFDIGVKNFTLPHSYQPTQVTKRAQQHTRCI